MTQVAGGYSPWRDIAARHPHVHVGRHDLRPARGAWVPDEAVILLDHQLRRHERRTVLAHEIAHIDLGHRPTGRRWFDRRQEDEADRLADLRLIPLAALADALRWALCAEEVAHELDVTVDVVRRRVARLTDDEKHWIDDRLTAAEGGVA